MAGQSVDFNAIAKQFGGVSQPPANAPSGPIDYAALAKEHGATGYTPAPTLMDHLKDEGFLDSAWGALKGTIGTIKDMFTGEYNHRANEMIRRYHELEKSGTPEERRQFAKEGLLQSIPFASTAYKLSQGNVTGAAGDLAGMAALPIAVEGIPRVAGAARTAARVVTNPEVVKAGVTVLPKGPAMVKLYDAAQKVRADAALERAKLERQGHPPPDRAPLWQGNPEPPPQSAPSFSSAQPPMGMDIEGNMRPGPLPSGRRVGPAPPPNAPPAAIARQPAWRGLPQPEAQPLPDVRPIATELPSGRIPGQPKPQPEGGRAPTAVVAPVEDMALLDGLAQSLAGKRFVRMSAAEQQGIRDIAARSQVTQQPQAAGPIPATATAEPPAAPVGPGKSLSQMLQEEMAAQRANAMAPAEPIPAPEPVGPVIDPKASEFHANGERKSPQFRGAEKTAQNTTAKAQRFAERMHERGVTSQDAAEMQAGRVSEAQIGQGVPPRWGNLADFLGENEPKTSVPEIIAELRRMEAAKLTSSANSTDNISAVYKNDAGKGVSTAKSPRDMTRAELAKQAGLPENATTEQIMQALAEAMNEEPKAAAAGKGK